MTIRELIAKYLRDNGYDGLAGDECGCGLDDLMPCDNPLECVPGHAVPCDCGEGCDQHIIPGLPNAHPHGRAPARTVQGVVGREVE